MAGLPARPGARDDIERNPPQPEETSGMARPVKPLIAIVCAAGAGVALVLGVSRVQAQSNIKPPQAQAWIDVATYSGFGMPAGAAGNPMAAIGSLFGGSGGAKNSFGNTQTGSAGRWVDVTLVTRNNPSLGEAQQAVPAGFLPSPLKLQAPKEVRKSVPDNDDSVVEHEVERPRGKLLLYWGCGTTVRQGQPKVLEMSTASAADLANFFVSRRATQRGTHSAPGRPVWPSPADTRMVPANASLAGEHMFSGSGVPEGFRFQIPAAQDLMPALDLKSRDAAGAVELSWTAAPTARAYFAAGMAAGGKDEMVIWTSSELADTGFGLTDYQTNVAVDRWLKEKVLLAPAVTTCTVPKGVFSGEGAMLRLVGYGNELNLAYPPRPADPKAPWEPVWAAKVRVKSVASALLGMPEMAGMEKSAEGQTAPEPQEKKPKPLDILRGILGK
jgi:hypothetical protein